MVADLADPLDPVVDPAVPVNRRLVDVFRHPRRMAMSRTNVHMGGDCLQSSVRTLSVGEAAVRDDDA